MNDTKKMTTGRLIPKAVETLHYTVHYDFYFGSNCKERNLIQVL